LAGPRAACDGPRAATPNGTLPQARRFGLLRQRVESLRAENQRLREENASLKQELAIAYGQQRAANTGG
jgi:regulator of replication initiation timing